MCAQLDNFWTCLDLRRAGCGGSRGLQTHFRRPMSHPRATWGLENHAKYCVVLAFSEVSWAGASEPPKSAPEAPRSRPERPREAQEPPRAAQGAPRSPQEAQKSPSKSVFKRASKSVFKRTLKSVFKRFSRPPQARCAEANVQLKYWISAATDEGSID